MNENRENIPAAVIGLGDYYRKVKEYLWNYMEPVSLIDRRKPDTISLSPDERSIFRQSDYPIQREALGDAEVSYIFTPHHFHYEYIKNLCNLGQTVFVEKPFAIQRSELNEIETLVSNDNSIYFSDFYVDVRALPLLDFWNSLPMKIDYSNLLNRENSKGLSRKSLGEVECVEGCILERYTIHDKSWMETRPHGGVIFDLLIHLLALLKKVFPDQDLRIDKVDSRYHNKGDPPAKYSDSPPFPDSAETYTSVTGHLLPSSIPVNFEVGKNYNQNLRYFKVIGSNGLCKQTFTDRNELYIDIDGYSQKVLVRENRYELVIKLFKEWLSTDTSSYGWNWNSWAVDKMLRAKSLSRNSNRKGEKKGGYIPPRHEDDLGQKTESSYSLSRREFARGVVVGILSNFLYDVLDPLSQSIKYILDEKSDIFDISPDRKSLINQWISPSSRVVLWPGSSHSYEDVPKQPFGFPHDTHAVAPFKALSPGDFRIVNEAAFQTSIYSADTLICTGSPAANKFIRKFFPYWKKVDGELEYFPPEEPPPVVEIPYHFAVDDHREARVISGSQGGVESAKKKKALISSDERVPIYSFDRDQYLGLNEWVMHDFLLITKIPLSKSGPDIVHIAGGHGAGTQAVELLFDEENVTLSALDDWIHRILDWKYYQLVFDVTDINHVEPMSIAHNINLSKDAKPRRIKLESEVL